LAEHPARIQPDQVRRRHDRRQCRSLLAAPGEERLEGSDALAVLGESGQVQRHRQPAARGGVQGARSLIRRQLGTAGMFAVVAITAKGAYRSISTCTGGDPSQLSRCRKL
tara:strand:+ start:917 stop:1246 length:330 start_codon:yes stop_codon:yes gene_type:complete